MHVVRVALAAALLAACSEPPAADGDSGSVAESDAAGVDSGVIPGSDGPLIDLTLWELAADDPFEDRPDDLACPQGFGVEDGLFEVDTELCHYGRFVQPSLNPVRAGDEVEFILVHDALYAEEPGREAHIGIALGEEIGWEERVPIPATNGFFRPIFVVAADAPVGTPVTLHIHNHGVNNYRVVEVTVHWQ